MKNGYVNLVSKADHKRIRKVVTIDRLMDLAILQVEPIADGKNASIGRESLPVGERVYVLGNPRGIEGIFSEGLISSTGKTVELFGRGTLYTITAPISPGNSGGPVFDSNGDVVAIVVGTKLDAQNLNYATDINTYGYWLQSNPAKQGPWAELFSEEFAKRASGQTLPVDGKIASYWKCTDFNTQHWMNNGTAPTATDFNNANLNRCN